MRDLQDLSSASALLPEIGDAGFNGFEPRYTGVGLPMVFRHTRFLQVDSEEVSSWII